MKENYNAYKNFLAPVKCIVTRIDDPLQLNRIQVYIPSYNGAFDKSMVGYGMDVGEYAWSQLCTILFKDSTNMASASLENLYSGDLPIILPSVGTVGWVVFEGGDYRTPIYLGSLGKGEVNEKVEGIEGSITSDTSNISLSGGSKYAMIREVVLGNESGGNYSSINPNDNGAISIGLIQWHEGRGLGLMQNIRDANKSKFNSIYSSNNASFSMQNWNKFVVNVGDDNYNAIKEILETDESKACQNQLIESDFERYCDIASGIGVTDLFAQMFFCDMYNQHQTETVRVSKNATSKTLDGLYNEVMSPTKDYWLARTKHNNNLRRTRTYDKIKELQSQGTLNNVNLTSLVGTSSLGISFDVPLDTNTIIKNFDKKSKYYGILFSSKDIGGNEVKASHSGNIVYAENNVYGYTAIITEGKYETRYCHLQKTKTQNGTVEKGDVIGYVGQSGKCNKDQLYFELRVNGIATDPLPYLSGQKPNANGNSVNLNASVNGTINNVINFAVGIANDDSYGYSQDANKRWGNGYYDCSSLVITAWTECGVDVKGAGATYTGNMRSAFKSKGFEVIDYSKGMQLVAGDVLLNDVHHTALYIGDNQIVHARTSNDVKSEQIRVQPMYEYSKGWDCVLRYKGA